LGVTEPDWFLTNAAFLCGFFVFEKKCGHFFKWKYAWWK